MNIFVFSFVDSDQLRKFFGPTAKSRYNDHAQRLQDEH